MTAIERLVADRWNTVASAAGLPIIRLMTPRRRTQLHARIAEAGLDAVLEAIEAVGKSSFCCGERGWKAGFDFVLQPKSFVRLLEGSYADTREKFRNGALEILMRESEQRQIMAPIMDGAIARQQSALPLLDFCTAAGDD